MSGAYCAYGPVGREYCADSTVYGDPFYFSNGRDYGVHHIFLWAMGPQAKKALHSHLPEKKPTTKRLSPQELTKVWKLYLEAVQKRTQNRRVCHHQLAEKTLAKLSELKIIESPKQ